MSVEFKDYYEILGVERSADDKAIKSAYRRLARKYHPDVRRVKSRGGPLQGDLRGHEVLSDPEKRQRYDTLGPDWQRYAQPGAGRVSLAACAWSTARRGDFSDFFRTIFGDLGARRAGRSDGRSDGGRAHQPRGSAQGDVHAPVGRGQRRRGRRRDHAGGGLQRRPQDVRVRGRRALRDLRRRRPRQGQAVRDLPRRRLGAAAAGRGSEDPGRRAHGPAASAWPARAAAAPERAEIST